MEAQELDVIRLKSGQEVTVLDVYRRFSAQILVMVIEILRQMTNFTKYLIIGCRRSNDRHSIFLIKYRT